MHFYICIEKIKPEILSHHSSHHSLCAFLAVRHCGCSDFRDMILILVAVGLALGNILTGDLTMLIIVLIQYLFLFILLLKACDPWPCFLLINLGVIAGTYAFIRYEPL